ncbi:single-stranded DNA-binding protein [Pseudarthrobacter polychromogenes]|uniref:Single-stranded DNA-binding protein n=1 Tax=Pseudarthrobacter polychromogenes TaxID=1676 RepID=A0ABQ1X9D3_9MICC|nr:single-stranded DNA-binding protein [Pseudarthrobacter polychromogenes]GGG83847.1 single-stranded DNA-binding protein [Pseudarthrobacter polychromogenes]
MAGELNITILGRLVNDVELRFTPSGAAVANFTIAQNARVFDKNSNEWKDKPANFFRCSAWRDLAENVAETLQKGQAVIAYGEVTSRSYETKEGQQRTVQEIEVSSLGPDLRWAGPRKQSSSQASSGGGSWGGGQAADTSSAWGGTTTDTEPPF